MRKIILCSFFFLCTCLLWLVISWAKPLFAIDLVSDHSMLIRFKESIMGGEIILPLIMSFLAGILASLSPCVYPLIPITLSIMGARKYQSHLQGFLVSLSYVCGISLIYTLLGAVFASIGMVLGAVMQHPLMLGLIACLFIVLSLSMFGVINIVLPDRLMRRLTHIGGQGKKGAFLMGLVAGVLAAPCTGPILGFILTLIANNGDLLFGGTLMLLFSFGIGAPFLLLGTFSSAISRMPKSGAWMDKIKSLFGAAMLGVAIYYLALAFPNLKSLLSVGLLYALLSLVIGVTILLLRRPKGGLVNGGGIAFGAVISAYAIAALLSPDIIDSQGAVHDAAGLTWHVIDDATRDEDNFTNLLSKAKSEGKPIMVDFYADWCVACKQLEQNTFKDKDVVSRLAAFYLLRVDATKTSDYLTKLQNRFKVIGLPTLVFIDKNGHELVTAKVQGFMSAKPFLELLEKIE